MDFIPRVRLHHRRPSWVDLSDPIFITICCKSRSANQLANPKVWSALLRAADDLHAQAVWSPRLLVTMPDHVHLICHVPSSPGIGEAIRLFKAKTAISGGVVWQRGAFDHRIRNNPALDEKVRYVLMNPVRAKLCEVPDAWEFRFKWNADGKA